MNDTSATVRVRFHRQLMSVAPEERLAMAGRMFDAAKALVRAAIAERGTAAEAETRRLLFLRFYGQDFSEAERLKILAKLAAA